MRHEHSHSFLNDVKRLAPEYRGELVRAIEDFLASLALAEPGKPPVFPDRLKVARVPDAAKVWALTWVRGSSTGRVTFQFINVDGKRTVRWRRAGALAVLEETWAARQGDQGTRLLPGANGLMAYARNSRGEFVYLERTRWHEHILPAHVTQSPSARGKRTTTWWPVQHTATGAPTMTQDDVVKVIVDAVRSGDWQNAPRGTLLSVYDLPRPEADRFGVSEVKVSAAPDGRILSAYPSAGTNVLAVRELSPEEQASSAPLAPAQPGQPEEKLFTTNVPATTFG